LTAEEEAERNVRNLATAADGGSTALDDLTAAAKRADATFAGSSLLFARNLGDAVSSVSTSLGKGVRFFETRFQTLRQLTDYGINFNYSMEAMETQVLNARLELSEFAALVKGGNDRFVGLGVSVSSGATNFLNATATMLNATDEFGNRLENRIARLGYTTDETVEAFLNYQNQLKFSDMGRRRDEATLRRGFLEYTEVLDDLAKLTGKERDKIQETMTDAARDPVMMARDLSLQEGVRGTSAQIAGEIEAQFGPAMASVVKDILGPGYLQNENIYAAGFDFTRTLEQIRIAQDRNDLTLVNELKQTLASQMSRLPTSAEFQALGVHDRSPMGQFLRRAVSDMNAAGAGYLNYQRATQDLIREGNLNPTAMDVERRVQAELTRQRNLTSPPGPGEPPSGAEGYTAFIDSQIENERRNQTLRQNALDLAYSKLSGVVTGLATTMNILNTRLAQDIANVRATVDGLISGLSVSTTELESQVTAAARTAASLGDEGFALSGTLQSQFAQYASATNEADRTSQLRDIVDTLDRIAALDAQTTQINATQAQINIDGNGMTINIPGAALPTPANNGAGSNGSIGTLGAVGRLFKNYGTETMTALHGLEAVLTPDQLSDVVLRTVDSTLAAASNNLGQSGIDPSTRQIMRSFTTGLTSIDGRLNTIRSNFNDNRSLTNTNELGAEAIGEIVALALGRMPTDMRDAFETALSNTIKNPIEQLVAVNVQNAETSSKIRRGITNMSTDYLRGA
jgi:hypothetical protein